LGAGVQRHALAALPPGKETRYPFYRRLGGPQIEEEVKERIALGIKAYYANQKFFKSRLVTKNSK